MKYINKTTNFFKNKKKSILYTVIFFVFFVFFSDLAFASDNANLNQGIEILNGLLKGAAILLTLGTNLAGWFLSPDWLSGSIIGINETLKTLWILVSNIVYFIFAFIFIWIAFMNIIGKEGDTYQLKQAIPRFIIGVIIVPFSWFFVQFIISISSLLTAAVLSIPYSSFSEQMEKNKIEMCTFGHNIVTIDNNTEQNRMLNSQEQGLTNKDHTKSETIINCIGDEKETRSLSEFLKGNGIYSIMYVYTYGVMRIDTKDLLHELDVATGVNSGISVLFKFAFDILFILFYSLLLIALILALFARIIRLWIFTMLSPIFGLLFFFKKGSEGAGGEGSVKNFNIKQFINLALVPVYVSGALVFGLLFISVASKGVAEKNIFEGDCFKIINQHEICWTGAFGDSKSAEQAKDIFDGFRGNFGTLLLQIFGLVFLWMGVMAALKSSSITQTVVEPIANFGKSIGELAAKAPTYAPIIPGVGSPAGLARAGQTFSGTMDQHFAQKGTEFGTKAAKFAGYDTDSAAAKMTKLINETNRELLQTPDGVRNFVSKLTESAGEIDKFLVDKPAKAKFVEGLKLAGVSDETILNNIQNSTSSHQLGDEVTKLLNIDKVPNQVKEALRQLQWTTRNGVLSSFSGTTKATQLSGDLSSNNMSIEAYNSIKATEENTISDNIKIVRSNDSPNITGVGEILVKHANESGAVSYNVNLQSVSKDAESLDLVSSEDIKELTTLFGRIGRDKGSMGSILEALGLRKKLADAVKAEYEKLNNNVSNPTTK